MKFRYLVPVLIFLYIAFGVYNFFNPKEKHDPNFYVELVMLISEFEREGLVVNGSKSNADSGYAPFPGGQAMIFEVELEKNARLFKSSNKEGILLLKNYYDKLGEEGDPYFSHTFLIGDYLIQMNGEIDKETFEKYVEVMKKFIKQ
jgi:hypothetical protein